jgi:hypothetical protein
MPSRSLKNRQKAAGNRATKAVANGAVPIFINTANHEFVNAKNPENALGYYSNEYIKPGDVARYIRPFTVWGQPTEKELITQIIGNPVTITGNSVLMPSSFVAPNVVLLNNSIGTPNSRVAAPKSRVITLNTSGRKVVTPSYPDDIEVSYYPVPVEQEPPPMKKKIQVVIGAAVVTAGILAFMFYKS